MKSCTHSGCDVKFSTTDSHPCCFAHRLCGRSGASGSTGGDACEHCSHWSALQVEACRKRRAAWDRARKRPSNPAAFSRPSPDSVILAVPAEMSSENPTPGPSPPTLTPVLEEASRGDPASPAPKSPAPTETQAILTALSRVVERLDSLENRERTSSTKRRPEARRSLDPESSSPPPKRGRGDTDSRRTAVESLPRLQTRAARSSPDRERPLSSNREPTPPRASRDGRAYTDTHQMAGRSSPHHRRHLVREPTRRETSGQPRPDPSARSTTSTSRRSRERSTPPRGNYEDAGYVDRAYVSTTRHPGPDRDVVSPPHAHSYRSRSRYSSRSSYLSPDGSRFRSRSHSQGRYRERFVSRSCSRSRDRAGHPFTEAVMHLVRSGPNRSSTSDPTDHPFEPRRADPSSARLPPHPAVATWYSFAERELKRNQEVTLHTPYVPPAGKRLLHRYHVGSDAQYLRRQRERPRGFREISNLKDEEAVRRHHRAALSLQPRVLNEITREIRLGISATSYACHLGEGVEAELEITDARARELRDPELTASLARTRDLLTQSSAATRDSLGCWTATDVNIALAQRDRFIDRLRPYLNPCLRHALRNGAFTDADLFPNLEDVRERARTDAAHESTRQIATRGDHQAARSERSSRGRPRDTRNHAPRSRDPQPFRRHPTSDQGARRGGPPSRGKRRQNKKPQSGQK